MTFVQDFATPIAPQKYGIPVEICSFQVAVFFIFPSLSFTVTTLVFKITTLNIPYESDYVMHDNIVNWCMFVHIVDSVGYHIGMMCANRDYS